MSIIFVGVNETKGGRSIKGKLSSFQIIILGFIGVIILGALLLMLPISTQSGVVTPFNQTLFTATSAVCVTGLIVQDTASYWSYFGQAVILVLIQIGGLGVISVFTFLTMLSGRKIGLMQRQTMQNAIAAPQVGGIIRLNKFVFQAAFTIEAIGALLLLPVFCGEYGAEGIWMSVFHSISAFCNAGFDLMGTKSGKFSSLTAFSGNVYLVTIISLLIIIGGIGFLTLEDVVTKKHRIKEYRMQSKVALLTSLILIIIPLVLYLFSDFSSASVKDRICLALFQAVTPRTAGFNTADFNLMTDAGIGIMMMLMLIGGSPGSTAGGMKTTTVAVLYANATATFKKRKNAHYYGRRIDDAIVKSASTIFFMYIMLAMAAAVAINLIEGVSFKACMFETFSAIGTVGLTLGITPGLGIASQIILMVLMFFGRVGGLTIIFAALSRKDVDVSQYPLENIMVG